MTNLGSSHRPRRGAALGLAVLLLSSWMGVDPPPASAQTYVNNRHQVPLWNQHHDFRTGGGGVTYPYNGVASSIPVAGGNNATGPFVTYDMLAADGRARWILNADGSQSSRYSLAGTGAVWAAADYYDVTQTNADIAGGSQHCAPASTAMWMEWLRQNALTDLGNRGGEVASIDDFGYEADTNQRKTPPGNGIGRLGTSRAKMIVAANAYVSAHYTGVWNFFFGPKIVAWNYSRNAYTRMIDRSKPPVVFYENLNAMNQGTGYGHVVVGVGYDGANAIVRDPWDATEKSKPFNRIQQLNDGLGQDTTYDGEPPSGPFDAEWTRARLEVIDLADFGDAPSAYEPSPSLWAGHQGGDREWLGANVSSEEDPTSPVDDPDGEANAGDHDHFDDGVVFSTFDHVNGVQLEVTVSSIGDMSLDAAFEDDAPPTLHLAGWIDWNKDFAWDDAERVVEWSGAADFDGAQALSFAFPMPPTFDGTTWARFRLSRGDDPVGPLGFARFGEVEDYSVSSTGGYGYPVPGHVVAVKPGGLVRFLAKPATGSVFTLPAADPSSAGASLRVLDTAASAGDETYVLPAGAWRGLGTPAGSKGHRYTGTGTPGDPCKIVLVKPRLIRAVCKGSGVTLVPPFAGDVGVVLDLGTTDRYCAQFDGLVVRNDADGTRRKLAPAPAACP
jgi:hypothetical protein